MSLILHLGKTEGITVYKLDKLKMLWDNCKCIFMIILAMQVAWSVGQIFLNKDPFDV